MLSRSRKSNRVPPAILTGQAPVVDDVAISGPDGELEEITGGRHFLYYFDDRLPEDDEPANGPLLEDIVREGAKLFLERFSQPARYIILSAAWGLERHQMITGLAAIPLDEIPPPHFWFGPKPDFYQAKLF